VKKEGNRVELWQGKKKSEKCCEDTRANRNGEKKNIPRLKIPKNQHQLKTEKKSNQQLNLFLPKGAQTRKMEGVIRNDWWGLKTFDMPGVEPAAGPKPIKPD